MAPWITHCQYALTPRRLSELRTTPRSRTPATAPRTLPTPPNRDVPPITVAEIAKRAVSLPTPGFALTAPGCQQHAGSSAAKAGHHEGQRKQKLDVEAGPVGGVRIAADGVPVGAQAGLGHDQMGDDADTEEGEGGKLEDP